MAGESAQAKAALQREKAARLTESADRWERGAIGESAVASALTELETSGWTVLHDLSWPGRKYANIDHVAIGNGRVFVIDSKNWSGEVSTAGGTLRQNGRSRAKEVSAGSEAARAVAGVAPNLLVGRVHPVLCLVRDDWMLARFGDVLVCSSSNLVAQLRDSQPPLERLAPQVVAQVVAELQEHSATVGRAHAQRASRPTRKRPRRGSWIEAAVKLAVAITILAVLVVQPAWFRAALDRAAHEFVSIVSPTTEPVPAEPAPTKKRKNREPERVKGE